MSDFNPATVIMMEDMPMPVANEKTEVNIFEMAWMVNAFSMASLGTYYWFKYPHMIETDMRLIRRAEEDDDRDLTVYDKEWAHETYEIKRWSHLANMLQFWYGSSWLLWLMNRTLDNEGG